MENNIDELLPKLNDKDSSAAYKALQELEKISDETGMLYEYTDKFAAMVKSDKYVIRVMGFRLFCKQAKWDKDNKIDAIIIESLSILQDENPTAVRQALAALPDIIKYKPDLHETIKKAVESINYKRYKESMQGLIEKDIKVVLDQL